MIRAALAPLLLLPLLPGCKAWITEKEAEHFQDVDDDGVPWDEDCDDDDPEVGGPGEWYLDADGDGWGDSAETVSSCGQPVGAVALPGDCDDDDDGIYPGAEEIPYDQIDQDCDEDDVSDLDGDSFDGKPADGDDCDDEDATIYPGAAEVWYDDIDQDCDGDPGYDQDEDGWEGEEVGGEDCDDTDPSVHPDAADDWYDGEDTNCDGADDYDQDGDGAQVEDRGLDCDDTDPSVNPEAEEICSDGVDNNCDGEATCGPAGATDLLASDGMRYGATKGDRAAHALAAAGNLDRDDAGYADLLVGARYSDLGGSNAGVVYVVSGPVTGSASLGESFARLVGEDAGDEAGFSVDGAGDMDVDGALDLVVGAPRRDSGDIDCGGVYLVLGPVSGDMSLDAGDVHYIAGDEDYDYAGQAVTNAGDLNRDGASDVGIGAPGADSKAGAVYIVSEVRSGDLLISSADGEWSGEATNDYAGAALDGAGDLDADGYDDLLVGAYQNDAAADDAGAAYLIFGPGEEDASLGDADVRLLGEASDDGAGFAVAGAGDVDGDGYADVVVGAPYEDTAGSGAGVTYLVRGPVRGDFNLYNADARVYGAQEDEQSGSALDVGDLNVDGETDLVIGAPYASSDVLADYGLTYLVFGPVSGDLSLADADATFAGTAGSQYAGSSVLVAGDTSGDGVDDLVVGAWGYATTSTDTNTGGLWMFLGGGL